MPTNMPADAIIRFDGNENEEPWECTWADFAKVNEEDEYTLELVGALAVGESCECDSGQSCNTIRRVS